MEQGVRRCPWGQTPGGWEDAAAPGPCVPGPPDLRREAASPSGAGV